MKPENRHGGNSTFTTSSLSSFTFLFFCDLYLTIWEESVPKNSVSLFYVLNQITLHGGNSTVIRTGR